MKERVLSIEQMKELQELDIDTSKASMYWLKSIEPDMGWELVIHKPARGFTYIPTFTFHDIIDILPKYLNVRDKVYFLTLMYDISKGVVISYCTEHIIDILHSEGSSNQLNAAFNMLKWCKQNNHI